MILADGGGLEIEVPAFGYGGRLHGRVLCAERQSHCEEEGEIAEDQEP
jgi:hypothetical protein